MFFSGLTISMSKPSYLLSSDHSRNHPFQSGNALISGWRLLPYSESWLGQDKDNDKENTKKRQKQVPPVKPENHAITLITAVRPPVPPFLFKSKSKPEADFYIKQAVEQACLSEDKRWQLSQMLEMNSEVCTLTPGRTTVFKHKIYTKSPLNSIPTKLANLNEHLKSM
jgi:hypothetical protein